MNKSVSETNIFTLSQGALLGHLFRLHGKPWAIGCGAVVALLVGIALILGDIRYAILALMIVFLIIPMLMSLLYFNYALKYDISFNALPHSLRLSDKGVEVRIFNYTTEENADNSEVVPDDQKNRMPNTPASYEESDDEKYVLTSVLTYEYDRFSRYDVGLKGVYYRILKIAEVDGGSNGKNRKAGHKKSKSILTDKEDGFLYIPSSAFASTAEYNDFITTISENKRK